MAIEESQDPRSARRREGTRESATAVVGRPELKMFATLLSSLIAAAASLVRATLRILTGGKTSASEQEEASPPRDEPVFCALWLNEVLRGTRLLNANSALVSSSI